MSGKSQIRWRQSDEDWINVRVHKANEKIERERKRLEKKRIPTEYLPPLIDKHELKAELKEGTRKDFNRTVKHIESLITDKTALDPVSSPTGNIITSWEYKKVKSDVKHINHERKKRGQQIMNEPATSRGQDLGLKRGEMGDIRNQEFQPKSFNFDKIRSGKEWEMYVKSVEKQVRDSYYSERNELYKENYIKGLYNAGLPNAAEIERIVRGIDANLFFKTTKTEEQASIDFIYDPDDARAKGELILEIWQNVANG